MGLNILAVFDAKEPIEWISSCLAGHDITVVRTIMGAMQVLQKGKVDVMLVQLHLENESMFDLLRSVRRNDYYSSMSFVCCETAKSEILQSPLEQFVEKSCLMMGANRLLQVHELYSDSLEQLIRDTIYKSDSVLES